MVDTTLFFMVLRAHGIYIYIIYIYTYLDQCISIFHLYQYLLRCVYMRHILYTFLSN